MRRSTASTCSHRYAPLCSAVCSLCTGSMESLPFKCFVMLTPSRSSRHRASLVQPGCWLLGRSPLFADPVANVVQSVSSRVVLLQQLSIRGGQRSVLAQLENRKSDSDTVKQQRAGRPDTAQRPLWVTNEPGDGKVSKESQNDEYAGCKQSPKDARRYMKQRSSKKVFGETFFIAQTPE